MCPHLRNYKAESQGHLLQDQFCMSMGDLELLLGSHLLLSLSEISGTKACITLARPFALFPAHDYHYDDIESLLEAPTNLTCHAASTLIEDF